jgi:hypothetical protein
LGALQQMGNRASEQADAVAALLVDPRCEKLLCLGNCTSSYPTVESTLRTMCRRGVKAVADLLRNAPAGHVDGLGTLIYCLQMLEDHAGSGAYETLVETFLLSENECVRCAAVSYVFGD